MQQLSMTTSPSDYWEERANKVLSNFKYKHPDEIDIREICWRYGVKIMPLDAPFIDASIDYESIKHLKAFSMPLSKKRRGVIYLKHNLDYIEKKLLLAEEFSHIYAHHQTQLTADKYQLAKCEKQARRMSAYLLMPYRFLIDVFDYAADQAVLISEIADYFTVTEELAQFRLELIFNKKVDVITNFKGNFGSIEWIEQ